MPRRNPIDKQLGLLQAQLDAARPQMGPSAGNLPLRALPDRPFAAQDSVLRAAKDQIASSSAKADSLISRMERQIGKNPQKGVYRLLTPREELDQVGEQLDPLGIVRVALPADAMRARNMARGLPTEWHNATEANIRQYAERKYGQGIEARIARKRKFK